MLTVLGLCVFMALLVAMLVQRISQPTVLNKSHLSANGAYVFEKPRIIKEFQLVDHYGKAFNKDSLRDKWTLMFFGYTACPDVCPTTLTALTRVYKQLQDTEALKDTQVVLVTVDPARDTVTQLAQYLPYFHEDFIGVTGEFLDIHRLATNVNVAFNKIPGGGENYAVDHSANLVLINPMGDYHGFFKPPFDLAKLKMTYRSIRSPI